MKFLSSNRNKRGGMTISVFACCPQGQEIAPHSDFKKYISSQINLTFKGVTAQNRGDFNESGYIAYRSLTILSGVCFFFDHESERASL